LRDPVLLDIRPYCLRLKRPWQTSRGIFTQRRGWLVRAAAEGLCGYGDCAPLPEAGTETPEAAWAALSRLADQTNGRPLHAVLAEIAEADSPTPAARCAVECALLDLAAKGAGVPLRLVLSPESAALVRVNAALGPLRELTPKVLRGTCHQGFRVLKVKVGLEPPVIELRRLRELSAAIPPEATFRLDANGAWDLAEATRFIAGLCHLPIESLEEPLGAPDADALGRLQAQAGFPLALDESLPRLDPELRLAGLTVRRLVLKPAVIGGLRRTLAVAERARDHGLQVVITSLLESAAGLWPVAQLAAAVASTAPQGLATSDWLADDLGPAPMPTGGCIPLPAGAGSGFSPSAEWSSHV
jgi:o-succinylbenzoate synthase